MWPCGAASPGSSSALELSHSQAAIAQTVELPPWASIRRGCRTGLRRCSLAARLQAPGVSAVLQVARLLQNTSGMQDANAHQMQWPGLPRLDPPHQPQQQPQQVQLTRRQMQAQQQMLLQQPAQQPHMQQDQQQNAQPQQDLPQQQEHHQAQPVGQPSTAKAEHTQALPEPAPLTAGNARALKRVAAIKRLSQCQDWQLLRSHVECDAWLANAAYASAALRQLARVHKASPQHAQRQAQQGQLRQQQQWQQQQQQQQLGLRGYSTFLQQLQDLALQHVQYASPQQLADMLWALGRLCTSTTASASLLQALCTHMHATMRHVEPKQLALCAWALGKLGWSPQQHVWDDFLFVSGSKLHACNAQDLSNIIWALAKLQQRPGQHWVADFLAAADRQLPGARPQAAANVLLGLAQLGHVPHPAWTQRLLGALQPRLHELEPQALATVLGALAKLQQAPNSSWLADFAAAVVAKRHQLNAEDTVSIAWALAVMDAGLDTAMLLVLAGRLHRIAAYANGSELARGAWAFVKLLCDHSTSSWHELPTVQWRGADDATGQRQQRQQQHHSKQQQQQQQGEHQRQSQQHGENVCGQLLLALLPHVECATDTLNAQDLANFTWALAKAQQPLQLAWQQQQLQMQQDQERLQSAATASTSGPMAGDGSLVQQQQPPTDTSSCSTRTSSTTSSSRSSMRSSSHQYSIDHHTAQRAQQEQTSSNSDNQPGQPHQPPWPSGPLSQPLKQGLVTAMRARLPHMEPQAIAVTLASFARLGIAPSWQWMLQFYEVTQPLLQRCGQQDLAMMLWALARLQQRPLQPWLAACLAALEPQLPHCPPATLSHVAWALGRGSWAMSEQQLADLAPGWQASFRAAAVGALPQLSLLEAAAILQAAPMLGLCNDGALTHQLLIATQRQLKTAGLSELLQLLLPAARLASSGLPHAWLEHVLQLLPAQLGTASLAELTRVMGALAAIAQHQSSAALQTCMQSAVNAAVPQLASAEPEQCVRALAAVADAQAVASRAPRPHATAVATAAVLAKPPQAGAKLQPRGPGTAAVAAGAAAGAGAEAGAAEGHIGHWSHTLLAELQATGLQRASLADLAQLLGVLSRWRDPPPESFMVAVMGRLQQWLAQVQAQGQQQQQQHTAGQQRQLAQQGRPAAALLHRQREQLLLTASSMQLSEEALLAVQPRPMLQHLSAGHHPLTSSINSSLSSAKQLLLRPSTPQMAPALLFNSDSPSGPATAVAGQPGVVGLMLNLGGSDGTNPGSNGTHSGSLRTSSSIGSGNSNSRRHGMSGPDPATAQPLASLLLALSRLEYRPPDVITLQLLQLLQPSLRALTPLDLAAIATAIGTLQLRRALPPWFKNELWVACRGALGRRSLSSRELVALLASLRRLWVSQGLVPPRKLVSCAFGAAERQWQHLDSSKAVLALLGTLGALAPLAAHARVVRFASIVTAQPPKQLRMSDREERHAQVLLQRMRRVAGNANGQAAVSHKPHKNLVACDSYVPACGAAPNGAPGVLQQQSASEAPLRSLAPELPVCTVAVVY